MITIKKINFSQKPLIGAVHFQSLPGFKDYTSLDNILTNAQKDINAFQQGGIHSLIFENNYDLPHQIEVGSETVASMTYLITTLKPFIKVPFGVCVLWNDYRSALSIALACGASFIRVPAFVDDVQTQYGSVYTDSTDVINFRHQIKASHIKLFTDIQVKHSQMIDPNKSLSTSASQAILAGSDGLIITGNWTGQAPELDHLRQIKQQFADIPLIVGSGASLDNLSSLVPYSDAICVSTSLKKPSGLSSTNFYDQNSRISQTRVRQLVSLHHQLLNVKLI